MSDLIDDEVQFTEEPDAEYEPGVVDPSLVSKSVLFATDWTTETILSQTKVGNIDLNPRFQRRDAWSLGKKSRFVESIIVGLPIPQIVLAEQRGQRGKFLVIDGKQRLLTLLQFSGNAQGKNNDFKLSELEIREDLIGKRFSDLRENSDLQNDYAALLNQPIRTVVIRNWPDPEFLHMVFFRLNTSSVPLSPQELRLALFPGTFVDFVDDKASESLAIRELLKIQEPDFRMRDVELLLRFLAFHYFLPEYAGNLRAFLDNTCRKLNGSWDAEAENIKQTISEFEEAILAIGEVFGKENVGRRWTTDGFEARLNRAVLDAQLFYFSDQTIRDEAKSHSDTVREAFKELCMTNDDFRSSIVSTTKSLGATYNRLSIWGKSLRNVLPLRLAVPRWDSETNRITFDGFWK